MSHINFDFLTESFLFGYGLEDNFSALRIWYGYRLYWYSRQYA